jgi:hypothetical protein
VGVQQCTRTACSSENDNDGAEMAQIMSKSTIAVLAAQRIRKA